MGMGMRQDKDLKEAIEKEQKKKKKNRQLSLNKQELINFKKQEAIILKMRFDNIWNTKGCFRRY